MNLSKLDGFQRVKTQTPAPVINGRQRKAKRHKRRSGQPFGQRSYRNVSKQDVRDQIGLNERQWTKDINNPGARPQTALTKRGKRQEKIRRMQGEHDDSGVSSGARPDIGYGRIYVDNQPASEALQGFNRVTYTNKELQGLSLQGHLILQGYATGDEDDIEDWDYLLSIEHPDTMQGFPSWQLQGKKERKARQAARRAKRVAKAKAKMLADTKKMLAKNKAKSQKKLKREERRQAGGKGRRAQKKAIRVAKKEERLQKKIRRRTGREQRKQQRLDDKATKKQEKQLTKRMKAEMKAKAKTERGGFFAAAIENIGDTSMDLASSLMRGDGAFESYGVQDFMPSDFGGGFDSFIEGERATSSEGALRTRDQALDFMDEIDEGEFILDEEPKKSDMMMPLLIGAGVLAAVTMGKKGKKKKS